MSENLKNINKIPVRTWRWLGVNDTSVSAEIPNLCKYRKKTTEEISEEGINIVSISKDSKNIRIFDKGLEFGVGEELSLQAVKHYNTGYLIEAKERIKEPVFINYEADSENPVIVDNNVIVAEENSEITIIMRYSCSNDVEAYHNGITRLYAQKGAVINLIKLQTLSEKTVHVDAIGAIVEENATINYILVELGAKNSVTNCNTKLIGEKSEGNINSVYFGDKDREIDINYVMTHEGKHTNSCIETRGALMDKSKKIFRGTLDFKNGAAGSKGKEEEYAVLLSQNVRNRSVPLLLCCEHDVEGQHAASTGKIDENKLFYLMSRGLSEQEAKKLIVEAAFNPITEKIPVPEIREEISEYIRRRLENVK